jgi:hypothetical protein
MQKNSCLCGCVVLALLLFAFSTSSFAGNTCSGTESCSGYTCDTACKVSITNNGSSIVMQVMINGTMTTVPYFCVASGHAISWQTTSGTDDFFFAKFASSPFTSNAMTIYGTPASAVNTTAGNVGCYAFGAAACLVSANATGGGCGVADPKVIITGGMGKGKAHAKQQK